MRKLKKSQIAKIYFKTVPFIIGEGLVLMSILSLFFFEAQSKSVISILLLFAGLGIVIFKILATKKHCYLYMHGKFTTAVVIDINQSSWEHNGRTMSRYNFEYFINGRKHNYIFKSAYHREITLGTKMDLYFDRRYSEKPFIPELLGLKGLEENIDK